MPTYTKIGILIEHNLGWLYTGIVLLKLLQIPIGTILGEARKASKVAVPDQHVYRVMGSEGYQVKAWLYVLHGVVHVASSTVLSGP